MKDARGEGSPPGRDPEALRRHYEVERELADRLRGAAPDERRHLYGAVYDEDPGSPLFGQIIGYVQTGTNDCSDMFPKDNTYQAVVNTPEQVTRVAEIARLSGARM